MRQLTYDEWRAMHLRERRLLMRAAYGDVAVPGEVVAGFDLLHLRAVLDAHEAETAEIPGKWTDSDEDDLCE